MSSVCELQSDIKFRQSARHPQVMPVSRNLFLPMRSQSSPLPILKTCMREHICEYTFLCLTGFSFFPGCSTFQDGVEEVYPRAQVNHPTSAHVTRPIGVKTLILVFLTQLSISGTLQLLWLHCSIFLISGWLRILNHLI